MGLDKYRMVNITVQPYSEHIKMTSSNTGPAAKPRIQLLDKEMADRLVAAAKTEKSYIWLNSTYRSAEQNTKQGFGSSHTTGMSVDIEAVTKKAAGTKLQATSQERVRSRVALAAKYSKGEDKFFRSGAVAYAKGHSGSATITDINGNPVAFSETGMWSNELNHIENPKLSTTRKTGDIVHDAKAINDATTKYRSTVDGRLYSDASPDKTPAYLDFERDASGKLINPKFTMESESSLTLGKVAAAPLSSRFMDNNIDVATSKVTVVGGKTPTTNVGATGNTTDSARVRTSYDPTKGSTSTYIKKTNYQLPDDDRSVTSQELGVQASMEDKRRRNFSTGYSALGMLAKYTKAEQPAAIRLILDKLFAGERSQAAIDKWEAYNKAGMTYIDQFVMERVSNQSKEAYRVVASLGDEYKVYFGTAAPEVLSITGYTLNTRNQQWLYDFRYFYENYLKGSKLVESRLRAFLTFTDSIYEVLPVSFSYSESAKIPGGVTISIDCVVLQWIPFGEYKDPLTRANRPTASVIPIHSAAQTQMSNLTQKTLSAVATDAGKTAGKSHAANYKLAMDQIMMQSVAAGNFSLPMVMGSGVSATTVNVTQLKNPPTLPAVDTTVDSHEPSVVLAATGRDALPEELTGSVQRAYGTNFEKRGPA